MQRPWLRSYPPGVAAEIDTSRYASLVAVLEESFARFSERPAFVCMGRTLTFAELDAASRALAAWLQSCGLKRGARVAVMMPNLLQYPVAVTAILRAGFTAVNVNPLYKPRELEFQLKDAGAEAIIVLENFALVLEQALPQTGVKHVIVASMGDMLGPVKGTVVNLVVRHVKKLVSAYNLPKATKFSQVLAAGRALTFTPATIGRDDIAFLQYTGGTTGVAKGAILLHRNLVANLLQVAAWHEPLLSVPPRVDRQVIFTALPLYHIFALSACFLLGVHSGALCVLIPNPRDINGVIKELAKYRVTMFPAVNTLYNALLNHKNFATLDWSMLKAAVAGGMAVQKAVADAWFEATGKPVIEGYGLSETSPVLTCNRGDITQWTGTIGLPLPSTDISIRGDDDKEVPPGERGEICARGPQVMPGYWQRPEETAMVMTADGFFRTGDIGVMDGEGRVTIVDRKKDMISVSGFKVFPNEVEEVAMMQGGVLECAAIGVPDANSGEAVKLFAVKKKPELTDTNLRRFMADRLTSYKVPKYIEFRTELPKTNVGKVLRRALRDGA
jgi:long-chain acyl-CoA synthetase